MSKIQQNTSPRVRIDPKSARTFGDHPTAAPIGRCLWNVREAFSLRSENFIYKFLEICALQAEIFDIFVISRSSALEWYQIHFMNYTQRLVSPLLLRYSRSRISPDPLSSREMTTDVEFATIAFQCSRLQVVCVSLVTPFGTSLVPEEAQCSGDHGNVFHFSARSVLRLQQLFEVHHSALECTANGRNDDFKQPP